MAGILNRWANAGQGIFELKLHFNDNTNGRVVLNQNSTKVPFDYAGKYFKKQLLHLEAVPDEGYVFWYWAETGNTNAAMVLNTDTDTSLTPVFRRASSFSESQVYTISFSPNPTQRNLCVRFFSVADEKGVFGVYNEIGQEVFRVPVQMKTIPQTLDFDFARQGAGVYFLEYRGENTWVIEKFVVVK